MPVAREIEIRYGTNMFEVAPVLQRQLDFRNVSSGPFSPGDIQDIFLRSEYDLQQFRRTSQLLSLRREFYQIRVALSIFSVSKFSGKLVYRRTFQRTSRCPSSPYLPVAPSPFHRRIVASRDSPIFLSHGVLPPSSSESPDKRLGKGRIGIYP